jgi:hypothetical protein
MAAAVDHTPLMRIYSVYQSGGPPRTHYLHHGDRMLGEYFLGSVAGRHVHGPGEDEPLVTISGSGGKTWFLADERGSVIAGTDANGNVAAVNRYDEYGGRREANITGSAIPGRPACTAASTTTRPGSTTPSSAGSCKPTRSDMATG